MNMITDTIANAQETGFERIEAFQKNVVEFHKTVAGFVNPLLAKLPNYDAAAKWIELNRNFATEIATVWSPAPKVEAPAATTTAPAKAKA